MNAFLFDMDGVLCDSEAFIAKAACRMFATVHNTHVEPADFAPFVGTGENSYLGGVAKKYGVDLTMPRDKETTYRLYAECVRGRLQAIPGVIDFIRRAAEVGIPMAVATSADRIKLEVNLDALGLEKELFGAFVTGSDIERTKPHPDIFLTAAQRLGVPPERCIVFEDAINGVQAAKAAGCRCIGVTTFFPGDALRTAGADDLIADFSDPDKLQTILGK